MTWKATYCEVDQKIKHFPYSILIWLDAEALVKSVCHAVVIWYLLSVHKGIENP